MIALFDTLINSLEAKKREKERIKWLEMQYYARSRVTGNEKSLLDYAGKVPYGRFDLLEK